MRIWWIPAVVMTARLAIGSETNTVVDAAATAPEAEPVETAAPAAPGMTPAQPAEVTPAPVAPGEVQAEAIPDMEAAAFSLDQFSIGTRVTWFQLETSRKNTFLGHIDELEAIQDGTPAKVYADWWFHRYVGAEVSLDRVEARTHNDDPEGISDGNLLLEGFTVSLLGRYPNPGRITPYAGLGWAFMTVDFDEEAWWALGYDSPESYEELGRPSVSRGKTREMLPESSTDGLVVTAGADVRLAKHWSANACWRYMDVDVQMGYRTAGDVKEPREIPMSNMAFGLGVKYVF